MTYDPDTMVAFDCETHLIQPGLLAPPLVCASVAEQIPTGAIHGHLMDRDTARDVFRELLKSSKAIVGANIAYDMLVLAVDAARQGVDLIADIFAKYDRGEVYDVQIAEALHAVGHGHLGLNPDGSAMKDSKGKVTDRYSLETCVRLVLGRDNAKVNDEWRLRYAELEDVPIDQWPASARIYPVDDAVNTLEVALAQVQGRPGTHQWRDDAAHLCGRCGHDASGGDYKSPCRSEPNMNLHDLAAQCRAAWALHLGAAWGFRVDGKALDTLEAKVLAGREAGMKRWRELGIIRPDGSQDEGLTCRLVARAYGCSEPCATCGGRCGVCEGSGKVPGARGPKKCPTCKGDRQPRCKPCHNTGLHLNDVVPRTDTGRVGHGRDALTESGDEDLIDFAAWSEDAKILKTYVPKLREGVDAPWNLRPNVLLKTGRASYEGIIQLMPREGGVRECIESRPGTELASVDFGSLELSTHGQSCLWLVGYSKLAESLNAGVKVHDAMGARLGGISYDEMIARVKSGDKQAKAWRQAAKPANFGFPGGMGAPKLVLQQRKQGPDTTGPDGRTYKGLRFCTLLRGQRCGEKKITEWKKRQMAPVCLACVECAEDIRNAWFETWPENREYFRVVSDHADRGWIEQHVSRRIRGGVDFTNAANGYFQALAADGAKLALYRVSRECYVDRASSLYGSRVILFAHDELIVEIPEDRAHDAAHRISEVMVGAMKEYVPDVVITAPPALMRRWFKGAEAVYDNGRLVPWEPKARAA
jgi:DNA polymerase-1